MRETAVIEAALDNVEKDFGPVWGAVANVGLFNTPPGFEVDDANWDGAFTQNLDSAFRLGRAALRRMTPRKEGSVIFISSIAGLGALGTALTYGTAKAAMNHMSKELARIAGSSGVRVNTIAPGNIIFPGGGWEANSTGPRADAWARWLKREVPLNRYGKPEEIGAAAASSCSAPRPASSPAPSCRSTADKHDRSRRRVQLLIGCPGGSSLCCSSRRWQPSACGRSQTTKETPVAVTSTPTAAFARDP